MIRKDARHTLAAPEKAAAVRTITAEAFKHEVQAWAQWLDVEPTEIHLTAMRRKWASCSSRGRITFDVSLLSQPEDFRREVVVHELLHLKVANHGPLFRALLSTALAGSQPSLDR
jgi:predicted metal-dependent hydrolase